jgi:hypothetical protein
MERVLDINTVVLLDVTLLQDSTGIKIAHQTKLIINNIGQLNLQALNNQCKQFLFVTVRLL